MTAVVAGAKRALAKTPDLLPVLKEVGVVDSGGQGLLFIYEGFLEALSGEFYQLKRMNQVLPKWTKWLMLNIIVVLVVTLRQKTLNLAIVQKLWFVSAKTTVDSAFDYETFRNYLNELGDSLLVVNDDEIIKVHVHTEHPGEVMNYSKNLVR